MVVDDIVGGDGRGRGGLGREDTPLQLGHVVPGWDHDVTQGSGRAAPGQQVGGLGHEATEALLVQPLPHVLLDGVDCVLEALGDGVAPQRLHVEAVGLGGEDQEGDDRDV